MILPFALDLTSILETVYQILAAGVAITAVALVMYATGFQHPRPAHSNLRTAAGLRHPDLHGRSHGECFEHAGLRGILTADEVGRLGDAAGGLFAFFRRPPDDDRASEPRQAPLGGSGDLCAFVCDGGFDFFGITVGGLSRKTLLTVPRTQHGHARLRLLLHDRDADGQL